MQPVVLGFLVWSLGSWSALGSTERATAAEPPRVFAAAPPHPPFAATDIPPSNAQSPGVTGTDAVIPAGDLAPSARDLATDTPRARRGDHVDVHHGVRVPDPYRWMEEMDSPETRRWVEAEDARARAFAARFGRRAALRDEIERLADVRRYMPPSKRGGRYFFLTFQSSGGPGTPGTRLHARDRLDGPDRTLIGEDALPDGTALARVVPGPDGRRVAYTVAASGSRWETVHVLDVETGRTLPDRLVGVNGGASTIAWAADGRALYYERFDLPAEGEERTARLENERVMRHTLGTSQDRDAVVYAAESTDAGLTLGLTRSGRHLVVAVRDPASSGNRVVHRDLGRPGSGFVDLVTDDEASYRFLGGRGSTLWFETDRDAPNGRVVAVDLGDGEPPRWREVVPEADEAINEWLGARIVGEHLIIGYLVDARTETRIFDLDGRRPYTLELPYLGSIWSGFTPGGEPDETETFYSLSGLADPGSIYRLDLETGRSELFARPELGYDPAGIVTRQLFYHGEDGTRIPMYIVHRRGLEKSGRAPVFMYGYGFGAWSAAPWFQPHMAVWLRMGGIWALPNTRGGGEYGEAWHRAGSRRNKQTAIDDYIAAAEWLIDQGYTTRELFVANASSAGGAVAAAALVQRPELFGAAVLDYPVLDMLRYDRFTGGRRWRGEYGTVDDAEDFRALLAYSPYHNVRVNRCHPATLVSPGELDEVTPPLHAYKFVASLRYAQSCDEPILLRVTWGAGHSSGATTSDAVETWTDQLSFLVRTLRGHGWSGRMAGRP